MTKMDNDLVAKTSLGKKLLTKPSMKIVQPVGMAFYKTERKPNSESKTASGIFGPSNFTSMTEKADQFRIFNGVKNC